MHSFYITLHPFFILPGQVADVTLQVNEFSFAQFIYLTSLFETLNPDHSVVITLLCFGLLLEHMGFMFF